MTEQRKSVEELRKVFLQFHYRWEDVNNPKGHATGEVWVAWDLRLDALMKLVRVNEGEDM